MKEKCKEMRDWQDGNLWSYIFIEIFSSGEIPSDGKTQSDT